MGEELCSSTCPSLVKEGVQHGVSMACPWVVDGEAIASTGLALSALPVSLVDRWPHMSRIRAFPFSGGSALLQAQA